MWSYRFQPYVNILWSTTVSELQILAPYFSKHFLAHRPHKIDVTLTNKFFLTGYYQYNQQG